MGRESVCQGAGGRGHWLRETGWGSRVGFGQVFRCLDAYVNFFQRFSVGNVESVGFVAKGGDYWDPVRCRGVIPEVRTEAKGRGLENFLSCTTLEPQFQQD